MTRRTLTALAAALALSACATAPDAPSRGTDRPSDIPTRSTAMSLSQADILGQVESNTGTGCVEFDGAWGYTHIADEIIQAANMRLTCMRLMPGGTAISSGVFIAMMVRGFEPPADKNAKIFLVHMASRGGVIEYELTRQMFDKMGAPGCLDRYLAGPWLARDNQVMPLSWNELKGNCK